ncbi:MAG: protein phosphatase 2C domain-containing protein [Desulfobacterota bacterium]|nr:protein phosphatase 2C domain-containing protein [Thermodesulfobacteriota bacterium]MDW8001505.1 PP2C family protein-serine/threonine phosphatase [Deltaproteobacteria bacterium]
MAPPVDLIKTGISEEIGYRDSYEDEYAIYRFSDLCFFSAEIYDGHGGKMAAQVASEMLTPYFIHLLRTRKEEDPISLIEEAYLAVDSYLVEKKVASGTTAAILYVWEDRFYASNAGDSKIVIGTENGVEVLTRDHKPYFPKEKERIEKMGGRVITYDIPRVQGILAISRALGDPYLKPYVIANPRIVEGYLSKENDYAIVACDGVWDVLEPEDVIDIARRKKEADEIAQSIVQKSLNLGSMDNITVVVVDLRDYTDKLERTKMNILRVWEREG